MRSYDEIKKLIDEKLSAPVKKGVEATISYFNNIDRMNSHHPHF